MSVSNKNELVIVCGKLTYLLDFCHFLVDSHSVISSGAGGRITEWIENIANEFRNEQDEYRKKNSK